MLLRRKVCREAGGSNRSMAATLPELLPDLAFRACSHSL